MILAASLYSTLWENSLFEAIDILVDEGFSSLEMLAVHPHGDPSEMDSAQRKQLKSYLRDRGAVLVSLNAPTLDLNLASAIPEARVSAQFYYLELLWLAADLEVERVVVCPGKRHPLMPAPLEITDRLAMDSMSRLATVAERLGTCIVLENLPFGYLETLDDVVAFSSKFSSAVQPMCDVANAHMVEDEALALDSHRSVGLIHLSDTTRESWRHDPIGNGDIDFLRLIPVLAQVSATIVLELCVERDLLGALRKSLTRLGEMFESSSRCLNG